MIKNLPSIKLKVINKFLFNGDEKQTGTTNGLLTFARAIKGKALTFGILLENGVLFTGLPIHSLCTQEHMYKLQQLQMWDCLSYGFDVLEIDAIKFMNCTVKLTSGEIQPGHYLFSIDFNSASELSNLSETPDEWKMFHFIQLDDGAFALYPQNRIMFNDNSLTSKAAQLPKYKVNTKDWKCEDWTAKLEHGYNY